MRKKAIPENHEHFSLSMPLWLEQLIVSYKTGIAHVFILHGNIGDLHNFGGEYVTLREGLKRLFQQREIVLFYNVSAGIVPATAVMKRRYLSVLRKKRFPVNRAFVKDPAVALPYMEQVLPGDAAIKGKTAVVIEYGESIFPNMVYSSAGQGTNARIITLDRWGRDRGISGAGNMVVITVNNLTDLAPQLRTENPGIKLLEIPRPGAEERRDYIRYVHAGDDRGLKVTSSQLDRMVVSSGGLMMTQIGDIYRESVAGTGILDPERILTKKIELIHKEYGDIVQVVRPKYGLESVGGFEYVKKYLMDVARLMRKGLHHRVPMGIILMGPPGTGKTFIIQCFAGECGLLVVKAKTLRAKYVGESERNQERFFQIVRALAPTIVVIDESEQEQAARDVEGKGAEVDNRMRAQSFQFWGDPSIRGKILRIDITNWPQMIDPAMRRAGRTDAKIPILLPDTREREHILKVILKKYRLPTGKIQWKKLAEQMEGYTPASIEQVILIAEGFAAAQNSRLIRQNHFQQALDDYRLPVLDKEDVARMTYAALQETSRKSLMPADGERTLKRLEKEYPFLKREL